MPGCRAVVDDGETGYLCKVRDGDDLAHSMKAFLALTSKEMASMGRAGRLKMSKSFDQSLVVEAYRNVLASEVSQSKSRAV